MWARRRRSRAEGGPHGARGEARGEGGWSRSAKGDGGAEGEGEWRPPENWLREVVKIMVKPEQVVKNVVKPEAVKNVVRPEQVVKIVVKPEAVKNVVRPEQVVKTWSNRKR